MGKGEVSDVGEKKPELNEILAVPHFHYDVEWWKTEDGYNRDVEQILLKALDMLDEYPEFTYVIDQALALKPFWDKHPQQRDRIRAHVAAGRIELVGGTWCAPDENIPLGEAFIRQFVHGLKFFEGEVGGKVTTAWEIDEFGHPAQTPQILLRCGLRHFVFARGVLDWEGDHPGDFLWEGPDGSRVLSHWFAEHYTAMMPLGNTAANLKRFHRELKARIPREAGRSPVSALMAPFGSDFSVPTEDWLKFLEKWNEKETPRARFALPRDFFRELEKVERQLPVVEGEFNPILTGCYESREKVKALCRGLESAALRAERWAAVAWLTAKREYPKAELDRAWELLLENDFHDIVCGTGTDKVYRNTLKRYTEAEGLIARAEAGAVEVIAVDVDTTGGEGLPLVVFNALNFDRRDVARARLSALGAQFSGAAGAVVRDSAGAEVLSQVEGKELLFIAEVPSVGCSTYYISPSIGGGAQPAAAQMEFDGLKLETPFYTLEMDEKSGGIARLFDREAGREALDTSRWAGNEFFVEEDAGNLWTVQKTGRTWRAEGAAVRQLPGGAVRRGFESRSRIGELTAIRRVYLYRDIRRIDFETWIDFQGRDRRVKVMFEPAGGEAVFETPFYAQPRGDGHWCAQNWVDIGGADCGAALMNTGTPGHDIEGAAVGMVLFRSLSVLSPAFFRFVAANLPDIARKVSKGIRMAADGHNNYEWALYKYHGLMLREWSSEGGPEMKGGLSVLDHLVPYARFWRKSDAWERGEHRFRYSLLPHKGSWADAAITEAALEINNPLRVFPTDVHHGGTSVKTSFLESAGGNGVILSALKMAEDGDGVVARFYESRGSAAPLRVKMMKEIASAGRVNFVENVAEAAAPLREGEILDTLRPWEIAAYRMRF